MGVFRWSNCGSSNSSLDILMSMFLSLFLSPLSSHLIPNHLLVTIYSTLLEKQEKKGKAIPFLRVLFHFILAITRDTRNSGMEKFKCYDYSIFHWFFSLKSFSACVYILDYTTEKHKSLVVSVLVYFKTPLLTATL